MIQFIMVWLGISMVSALGLNLMLNYLHTGHIFVYKRENYSGNVILIICAISVGIGFILSANIHATNKQQTESQNEASEENSKPIFVSLTDNQATVISQSKLRKNISTTSENVLLGTENTLVYQFPSSDEESNWEVLKLYVNKYRALLIHRAGFSVALICQKTFPNQEQLTCFQPF